MNSNEFDKYYERNKEEPSGFFTDYLIDLLPKKDLIEYNIAELGVGNGANLFLLKNYANECHGYEASLKACCDIQKRINLHPLKSKFFIKCIELPNEFYNPIKYDLVIFGFLAYHMNDCKLKKLKEDTLHILKGKGSYIYLYDFLARDEREKPDSHNSENLIYKRNFKYWLDYFDGFDLVSFKLFNDDCRHNKIIDNLNIINTNLTYDDDKWMFCALFRKN